MYCTCLCTQALASSMTAPPDYQPPPSDLEPHQLVQARCQISYSCIAQGSHPMALAHRTFKRCVPALSKHRPEPLSRTLPPRTLIVRPMLDFLLQLALRTWRDGSGDWMVRIFPVEHSIENLPCDS